MGTGIQRANITHTTAAKSGISQQLGFTFFSASRNCSSASFSCRTLSRFGAPTLMGKRVPAIKQGKFAPERVKPAFLQSRKKSVKTADWEGSARRHAASTLAADCHLK